MQIFQFYSLNKNENEYCDNCEEKGVERHDCKKQKEVPEDEETSEFLKEATNPHGTSSGLTSCQDFARDGCRCTKKAQGVVTMRVQEKRTFGQGGSSSAKGLRRKVWTWMKILSPNIHFIVAILGSLAIYALL